MLCSTRRRCLSNSAVARARLPPDSPNGSLGCVSGATPRKTGVVGVKITYFCSNSRTSSAPPPVTSTALSAANPRSGLDLDAVLGDRPTRRRLPSSHDSALNLHAGVGSFRGLCNEISYLACAPHAPKKRWGGIFLPGRAEKADLYSWGTPGRTPRESRL